jgi:hypothetical protein
MNFILSFYRYERRLQNEQVVQLPQTLLRSRWQRSSQDDRQPDTVNNETTDERELRQFIREEINYQRIRFERQSIYDLIIDPTVPASSEFIANFRMQQHQNPNFINSEMMEQEFTCIICVSTFELGYRYGRWPCPSTTPHIFHPDCMLNWLRRKNTCPICRHPVTASQITNDSFGQFMARLVF